MFHAVCLFRTRFSRNPWIIEAWDMSFFFLISFNCGTHVSPSYFVTKRIVELFIFFERRESKTRTNWKGNAWRAFQIGIVQYSHTLYYERPIQSLRIRTNSVRSGRVGLWVWWFSLKVFPGRIVKSLEFPWLKVSGSCFLSHPKWSWCPNQYFYWAQKWFPFRNHWNSKRFGKWKVFEERKKTGRMKI